MIATPEPFLYSGENEIKKSAHFIPINVGSGVSKQNSYFSKSYIFYSI